MLDQEKELPTTQGGHLVIIILPIKSKMAAAKKRFSVLNRVFTYRHSKSGVYPGSLQMTINFALV